MGDKGGDQMSKTNFQLIRLVLDELLAQVRAEHGTNAKALLDKRMTSLSASYAGLNQARTPKIDYSDAITRCVYVYKYVASNADYIYQILVGEKKLADLFNSEKLHVTCIGGGPGSDLIGLLKFILRQKKSVKKITCYLCDQEQAWADSWTDISDKIESDLQLNANFQALDVTDPKSWQKQRKFLNADLFTLSFFISEVVRFDGPKLQEFWKTLFGEAKSGAYFFFVDNGHTDFTGYFDKLHKAHSIETLASDEFEITPSMHEQTSDLGEYIKIFGEYPRLKQRKLAYRLLRKK
jgi:hypothetical protein